jgi:phosphatidylglycerol---prolipoprotein diacylglyceryl transferase
LFPVLFTLRLGGREIGIHSYGVLIAIGLALAIALAYRHARRVGLDGGRVLDLAFWMTLTGLVTSRLAYVVVNIRDFARVCVEGTGAPRSFGGALSDCARVFAVWQGGLVFLGGVAGAAVVAYWFARREGWSFAVVGDLFAPALALGHAFGRAGCYAAGCCFGKASDVAWAVAFPRSSVAFDELTAVAAITPGASVTPPLHPTQLYEAAGELAIGLALIALRPRLARRPGALLFGYLAAYAVLRFVVEMFRGDVARGFILELNTPRLAALLRLPPAEPVLLSVGQLGSLLMLAALAAVIVVRRRRLDHTAPQTPAP